jgi:hypothetical protein
MILLTFLKENKTDNSFVTAKEFLVWAKEDLKTNDKRSIGNGLGNIKKAIHSRIDEIIDSTHVKYCKGWNKRADTDTKLEVLSLLNIKFTNIVSLLTEIRNNYEHLYKLPTYKQAQAYLATAEMWLDQSYEKYSFNKIAIVNLKTKDFGIHYSRSEIKVTNLTIDSNSNLDYLWDNKKEVHEIKNGKLQIKPMINFDWKTMAKYESKHLNFSGTHKISEHALPAKLLTHIYKKAVKELVR